MKTEILLGGRVRELRMREHMNQQQLGEAVGLTQKSVSSIEVGRSATTVEKLVLLAEYFHVSTDYLLGITDDPAWRGQEETQAN